MAEYTRDSVLRSADASGNTYVDYPVTRGHNVIMESGKTLEEELSHTHDVGDINGFNEVIETKADKVEGATEGNFAGLDENGNLTDSGKKAADFIAKVSGATVENLATLTAEGGLADGGATVAGIISQATAAGLKVETGSYTGTKLSSTTGSATNYTTVYFTGKPLFVFIASTRTATAISTSYPSVYVSLLAVREDTNTFVNCHPFSWESDTAYTLYRPSNETDGVEFGDNYISFYSTKSYACVYQCDCSYCEYAYFAITE